MVDEYEQLLRLLFTAYITHRVHIHTFITVKSHGVMMLRQLIAYIDATSRKPVSAANDGRQHKHVPLQQVQIPEILVHVSLYTLTSRMFITRQQTDVDNRDRQTERTHGRLSDSHGHGDSVTRFLQLASHNASVAATAPYLAVRPALSMGHHFPLSAYRPHTRCTNSRHVATHK